MFSGIIQALGTVVEQTHGEDVARLTIKSSLFETKDLLIGSSVAVNGVCLTITALGQGVDGGIRRGVAAFDIGSETLRRTTLGEKNRGDQVNLECSLRIGDPIDGHFVLGHTDSVAALVGRTTEGSTVRLECEVSHELARFLVPKGSVSLDGVSLTVGEVSGRRFSVYVIPHTLQVTTLGALALGEKVNIEIDCIARYLDGLTRRQTGEAGL